MAFSDYEESIQSGEPIELYEFSRSSLRWRYTSDKRAATYNSYTWLPEPLKRSEIEHSDDKGRSAIKIECRRDFVVADLFRVQPPSDVVLVTVHKFHAPESVGIVEWMGRVINAEWKGAKAILTCEPAATAMMRPGLRRLYQRSCPHVLYGVACGVNRATYAVTATLSAVTGAIISSTTFGAHPDGYFAGGFIEFVTASSVVERRYITDHVDGDLTLSISLADLAAGSQVVAYPGCPHTTEACRVKFNNLLNYGGFPYIPTKNPMGGTALY